MISTNTEELFSNKGGVFPPHPAPTNEAAGLWFQVSLLILMVGNLDEKSLALAAILIAT
jgi:hypothetical protein